MVEPTGLTRPSGLPIQPDTVLEGLDVFDMRRSAFGGFRELEGKHAVVGALGSSGHMCAPGSSILAPKSPASTT